VTQQGDGSDSDDGEGGNGRAMADDRKMDGGITDQVPETQLLSLAKGGDEQALDLLFRAYRELIKSKANLYFLAGGERDDLIQEGMIGLFRAIMDYAPDAGASFRTFAELCISRQMMTAIKAAARMKHAPLNTSVSLFMPPGEAGDEGGEVTSYEELIADSRPSPEEALIAQEQARLLETSIEQLFSGLERAVWEEFRKGASYQEIAHALGKPPKTVDNAIQRIKRKIAGAIAEGQGASSDL
jgi:RNA polymerase sporulation-specific sigma factor